MIVVIIICSCVVLCLYIIAKIKCSSLDCCGLHVIRDVQAEVEVEEFRIDHHVKELPTITDILH